MQQINKSEEELRADLEEMQRLIRTTDSPSRRKIFEQTAAYILAELEKRQQESQRPVTSPEQNGQYKSTGAKPPKVIVTPVHPPQGYQQLDPLRKTFHVFTGSGTPISADNLPEDIGRADRPRAEAQRAGEASSTVAHVSGGPKEVVISWNDGTKTTLTEGVARSRFTSAFRDLAKSGYAKKDRLPDLIYYRTYHRACGFYQALTLLWGRAPSPLDLDIAPLSKIRAAIFDMITAATATAAA